MRMRNLVVAALLLFTVTAEAGGHLQNITFDSDSVKLRFPLYDAQNPELCATDVDALTTANLVIRVSDNATSGYSDTFTRAASTLEGITTIGSYVIPTANKARFEIIAAGSCVYELQLNNLLFATSGASVVTIEISDGGTEIIDSVYWVDFHQLATAAALQDVDDDIAALNDPTAATIAAAVGALIVEGTTDILESLRLANAVLAGNKTATQFKSIDGAKNRVEFTESSGTRTITSRDVTP